MRSCHLFQKFLVFAIAPMILLALATACMDDINDQYDMSEGVVKLIPFTVKATTGDETKVIIDYNRLQRFEPNDKLEILSEDGKLYGTLDIDSGGASFATFSGTLTYTGSGTEPDPGLILNATLISENDRTGGNTFVGGIAATMADVASQFSLLTAQSTYRDKSFDLDQGSAFVDFTVNFEPAPTNGFYPAELTIAGGETSLGTANVSIVNGVANFALAFPGGSTLDRAKVTLCGKDFKFAGSLVAATLYKVTRTYDENLFTPLTLEAAEDCVISFNLSGTQKVYYTVNGGDKIEYTAPISVSNKAVVQFYGDNATYSSFPTGDYTEPTTSNISCTGNCYIYGNIMSLISSTGFPSLKEFSQEVTARWSFAELFKDNTYLQNHSSKKLVLPATTLAGGCYYSMFRGCTGLTAAPDLPASTLERACYYELFRGCSNLVTPPSKIGATLADYCCGRMFWNCSRLETAPELPATQLTEECYISMFRGCASLKTAPELPATQLAFDCYGSLFEKCFSLTQAPALPATQLEPYCYENMFVDCENLLTAPDLPASTLAEYCYYSMFKGCDVLASAPELKATSLTDGCYQEMFYNCRSLTSIKCLATVLSGSNCLWEWVYGVASSGTFTKAEGMTGWPENSISGIPDGWTVYDVLYESTDYSQDQEVIVVQSASEGNGVDLVFMGEGYSDRLIADGTYMADMNLAIDYFFNIEPYTTFRPLFNVYVVNAVSKNEVFDPDRGTESAFSVVLEGANGLRSKDTDKIVNYAKCAVGTDGERVKKTAIVTIINANRGRSVTYMADPAISLCVRGRGGSTLEHLLHHEAGGHAFGKLADEYVDAGVAATRNFDSEKRSTASGHNRWRSMNIDFTNDPDEIVWSNFLKDERYAGKVGIYEGADYFPEGVYRSTENSVMTYLVTPYNAPSREAIYYRIHWYAYGDEWVYNYEDFATYDAINRQEVAPAFRSVFPTKARGDESFRDLTAPPIYEYDNSIK